MKQLADILQEFSYRERAKNYNLNSRISYIQNEPHYTWKEGELLTLNTQEMLVLFKKYPENAREQIILANFEQLPASLLSYESDDLKITKKNLANLRLPFYSENLGETIFQSFKEHLQQVRDDSIRLEAKIKRADLRKLDFVLLKQIYVWEKEKPIDCDFFKDYKFFKSDYAKR